MAESKPTEGKQRAPTMNVTEPKPPEARQPVPSTDVTEEKPTEASQPVQSAEKRKTCLDCGLLTIEGRELSRRDRAEVGAYHLTKRGGYWESGGMPADPERTCCFNRLWKLDRNSDWFEFDGQDYVAEIGLPRDGCPDFVKYKRGLTPAQHITPKVNTQDDSKPSGDIELDKQNLRIRVDGRWYDLTPKQRDILDALIDAQGAWVSGKQIFLRPEARPDKTIKKMPTAAKNLIESSPQGYRIKRLLP